MSDPNRFAKLTFEDFRRLAQDDSLSKFERIGFPDSYRQGHEEDIYSDIRTKLPVLDDREKIVVDIGPGCSDLPLMIVEQCRRQGHQLFLIDSGEMLSHLPDEAFIRKVAAMFPHCDDLLIEMQCSVDAIICYSVLHYILLDTAFFRFLDRSLSLLAPGGRMLIGDIPNVSKRKRFFSSEAGAQFHRQFMNTTEAPKVEFNKLEHDQIDDAVVMAILQRARTAGFDAYVLPQNPKLPMANRREDIVIVRP